MTDKSLDKALISLSIIKVNWDQQRRDYIDNFLPFLATLMVRKKYESIEENPEQINKLINDFEQEFGLIIPYHPMITILNRAKKRGLINYNLTLKLLNLRFADDVYEEFIKIPEVVNVFNKLFDTISFIVLGKAYEGNFYF